MSCQDLMSGLLAIVTALLLVSGGVLIGREYGQRREPGDHEPES
jgi:hypothetical protein